MSPLLSILGYIFSIFYGIAAVYLVFETRGRCPFRWPFLFGLIGGLSHFVLRDMPEWWPPSITKDMLIALLLLLLLFLGIALLMRIINEYDLRYPRTIAFEWYLGLTGGNDDDSGDEDNSEPTTFDRYR